MYIQIYTVDKVIIWSSYYLSNCSESDWCTFYSIGKTEEIWKSFIIDFSKRPPIIVNIEPSVQNLLFYVGGGVNGIKRWFRTLSTFHPFSFFFMANYLFEKCWFVHFWDGIGVSESMFCTLINFFHYGWPLMKSR